MICHCGHAARGFGYQHPVLRGPRHPTCSMACLDMLVERQGDMIANQTELEAIENAMRPHIADVRAFFATNPPDEDILEWQAWAYDAICDQIRVEYAKPVTADDVPF